MPTRAPGPGPGRWRPHLSPPTRTTGRAPRRRGRTDEGEAHHGRDGSTPNAVELRGITKRFPGVVANRDIELTVRRGEIHAIVGENGAGKSTLMKTLYGEHRPDEGTIRVDGRRAAVPQPGRRHRRRHRHGPPALHAGRQLHGPGEHRPGQRAEARRPPGPRGGPAADPGDLRPLHARAGPRRARRGPRRRCPPAGRDRQGALPRRPHPDPRRADRRPGAAGGRRALRQPQGAHPRGPDGHLHLAQARRGPPGVRLHHGHPPRHDRRDGRSEDDDGARAGRDDGRRRAALAGDPHLHRPGRARPRPREPDRAYDRGAPAHRRRQPHRARGRGRRHRGRGGQRPGRAGRRDHGPAAARRRTGPARRRQQGRRRGGRPGGRDRLDDAGAPGGRPRLHPGGPAPAGHAARGAAVGEPDPRPPDAAAGRQGHLHRPQGRPGRHRADHARVRRPRPRAGHAWPSRCPAATSRSSSSGAR